MKKKFGVLLATVFCISIFAISLTACNFGGSTTKPTTGEMKQSELIGFSAATSATILSKLDNGVIASASNGNGQQNQNDPTPEQIAQINAQIEILEAFISDQPVTVVEQASDKAEYQKMMLITTKDLTNETIVYTLYFNEEIAVEEADDDDDNEVETEQEYLLTGIMLIGDTQYTLSGEKEFDGAEYELELKASVDNKNYVIFKQEIEADEQEFQYKIVQNGVCVKNFSIELENENGKLCIKMKNSSAQNGSSISFNREVENNKTYIKIVMIEDGVKTTMKVSITTNLNGELVYNYKFQSGNTMSQNRYR